MDHLAVETRLDWIADEVADAKDTHETDDTLRQFGECAVGVRNVLYQDRALSTMELHFIDNHFQVLQMAYLRWKRRHWASPKEQKCSPPLHDCARN